MSSGGRPIGAAAAGGAPPARVHPVSPAPPEVATTRNKRPPSSAPRGSVAAARGKAAPADRSHSTLWENVKSIGGALLIFLFVRTFLVEAYRIPSGSMIPTLLVGDWLFVNKLRFGPHVPFTSINLPGYAEPERDDVVVFVSPPQDPSIRTTPDAVTPTLVKRLVGVPGDTLFMRDGVLHVNGAPRAQGSDAVPAPSPDAGTASHPLFQWLADARVAGTRFDDVAPAGSPTLDAWGPIVLPAGRFFMLGDNRYNSVDSRFYGLVPRENVRGRPLFIYYSWNADSDEALPFLTDIRWRRIGHWIE